MSSCAHCKKRIALSKASCPTCRRIFHKSCIARFLQRPKAPDCCRITLASGPESLLPGPSGTSFLRLLDHLAHARALAVDCARGIEQDIEQNPELMDSASDMTALSQTSSRDTSINLDHNAGIPRQITSNSNNTPPSLPSNWEKLSQSQQSGMLFQMLAENQNSIRTLIEQQAFLCSKVEDHDRRLTMLEQTSSMLNVEVDQLKELRHRGVAAPEIKINGIPPSNTLSIKELANKILEVLKLQSLCNDILSVREIKSRNSSHATTATNINETTVNNLPTSFVIQLKSHAIQQHILQAKRRHGPIKFSDFVPGGSQSSITLFEMLPPAVHALRLLAKEKALARGYKHVWASNGIVFVRKNDNSVAIPINTENDLNNIL